MTTLLLPASTAPLSIGWTAPEKAFASSPDGQFAVGAPGTLLDYRFADVTADQVPDGSTILAVSLLVVAGSSGDGTGEIHPELYIDNTQGSPAGFSGAVDYHALTYQRAITLDDLRTNQLGARVTRDEGTGDLLVDAVWLQVDYTAPDPPDGPALMDPQPPPAPLWRGQGDQGPWYQGDDYLRAKRYQNEPETE